jgi:hypothetical protein
MTTLSFAVALYALGGILVGTLGILEFCFDPPATPHPIWTPVLRVAVIGALSLAWPLWVLVALVPVRRSK